MRIFKDRNLTILTLLYLMIILIFSSMSNPQNYINGKEFRDKIYHFSEYFILGTLLALSQKKFSIKYAYSILSVGAIIAILDEAHQHFIPRRVTSYKDFLADITGVVVATIFVYYFSRRELDRGTNQSSHGRH